MKILDPKIYSEACYAQIQPRVKGPSAKLSEVEAGIAAALKTLRPSTPTAKAAYVPPVEISYATGKWIQPGPATGLAGDNHDKDGISITFLGESHKKNVEDLYRGKALAEKQIPTVQRQFSHLQNFTFDQDILRAQSLLTAIGQSSFGCAPLLIIERGLDLYAMPEDYAGGVVREPALMALPIPNPKLDASGYLGYGKKERSACVAGYILACLEADSSKRQQVTVLFGDEHSDILAFLESLGEASQSPVLGRERRYMHISSQVAAVIARYKRKYEQQVAEAAKQGKALRSSGSGKSSDDEAPMVIGSLFDF